MQSLEGNVPGSLGGQSEVNTKKDLREGKRWRDSMEWVVPIWTPLYDSAAEEFIPKDKLCLMCTKRIREHRQSRKSRGVFHPAAC